MGGVIDLHLICNLLELNEIGTGQQQPHGFEWSEE